MKILLIHKFLYPKGGAETYVMELGRTLEKLGHEVQYFGMEHPDRILGNRVGAYTKTMDFHQASALEKLRYGFRVIWSREAQRKLRQVLADFQPDVCHLNNFNYQLTPSILVELKRWRRKHPCRVVYTAHDYQLVCPNHMCFCRGEVCEKCLGGHYGNCVRNRCIHGSFFKSLAGAMEGWFWNRLGIYEELDSIVCCSEFLKEKLDSNPVLREKTVVLHNFTREYGEKNWKKQDYVLYFGRYSEEKGIRELLDAAKKLPHIPFVFAGSGPLEDLLTGLPNVKNVGFQRGDALEKWVGEARFTVCPSQWYENCPFSVLESLGQGTFVLGADMGGIPELIRPGENGDLFINGELTEAIRTLWEKRHLLPRAEGNFDSPESYCEKLLQLYRRKRVLYVTNIPAPYRGRFFGELAKNWDLTVVYERQRGATRDKSWGPTEGASYRTVTLRGIPVGNEGSFAPGILRELQKSYDGILVGCYNTPTQMLAILALRLWKKSYFLNFDGEPFLMPGEWKTPVKKFFLRGAKGYLAGGEQAAESLRKVVAAPVMPYYFSSLSEAELKERRGTAGERGKEILVVAQYLPCKGLDAALEAARMDGDLSWHFVGMGERMEDFLKDYAGKIPENVRMTPFLQKEDLEWAYQSCAVLVLPSRRECWGLVIQEAASFATPIVSTWGSGAAVEFLSERYPQYLAKPGDGADLYRCVKGLLSEDREDYGRFLQEKAAGYSIEKGVQAHLRLMEECYGNGDCTGF